MKNLSPLMKKSVCYLVFLLLMTACGKDICTMEGTIAEGETFPEGQMVYLISWDADKDESIVLDSTIVVNGHFTLKAPANASKNRGDFMDGYPQ